MKVIVAGTVAIDDVKTPKVERTGLMGGSAAYAAMSCSFFATTRIVGILQTIEEHVVHDVTMT